MWQEVVPRSRLVDTELTVAWTDGRRMCLYASGEWDLATADRLARLMATYCRDGRLLRVDLSQVTFLDCACLQVLVDAHQRLLAAGGSLVLSGLPGCVARLVRLAGLHDVLYTTRVSDRDDHADPLELMDVVPVWT